ncbi:epoxyqueuosine reductase QueH [Arcobacter sp. FWKO B]|nr:epoxyqueuosine reductase QueH [Arcobacter sp. FWKO B]
MVVQICCSVDSHYFLECLRKDYPDSEVIGFFYNPNIHPYSEYLLRYKDVEFSCNKLNIKLIDGIYDINKWYEITKGYENEPEKGDRCTICFDDRLYITASKAKELGADKFTTSLLMSPLKSQEKLRILGNKLAIDNNLEFIFKDYRSGSGGINQSSTVKSNRLYRQNYCGCMYALNAQRLVQNRLSDELMSPISKQILPNSIEYRLEIFQKRDELYLQQKEFFITKVEFLNYRILTGITLTNKKVLPSYFLAFSYLKTKNVKGKIEFIKDGIGYLNKNGVILVTTDKFNSLAKTTYTSTKELMFNAPSFIKEMELRYIITNEQNSTSPIIIIDEIYLEQDIEISLESIYYNDTKDKIEIIS